MKEFLSSLLSKTKQFLTAACSKLKPLLTAACGKIKPLLSSVLSKVKPMWDSMLCKAKPFLSSRLCKLLALILVLLLVLILGLSRCSAGEETPSEEPRAGIVTVESLDVHKKPKAGSRVLGQLPQNLEIEILEEKTVKDTTWGLIDKMALPDGSKVGSGWIDLQGIIFASDIIVQEEPVQDAEPEPAVTITMGTITASKLNIRKGPGSNYDSEGFLYKGDRVEILETQTVDDTVWGRMHKGWIGMGYVRMDGTYTSDSEPESNSSVTKSDGNTTVLGYGLVTINELNVRLGPDTIYGKAGTIPRGTRYAYYQLLDGWARIESGWVSTEHFYIEGTATQDAFRGVVNTDSLNVRTGPHTNYMLIDTYLHGETVDILSKFGNWGCTEKGWVYLEYVDPSYTTGTGTITSGLNIRLEPTADSEIVGTYTIGDRITVIEVMDNWGQTDLGWINLKYVAYD